MAKQCLSPKEAADLIGKTPLTLARWRKAGAGPPYIKVGERYEYRRDLLLAWRNGDHTHIGQMVDGWPEVRVEHGTHGDVSDNLDLNASPAATGPWSIDAVTKAVADWKEQELWRRAKPILSGSAFYPEQTAQFNSEVALVDPKRTEADDAIWLQRLTDQTVEIAATMGFSHARPPQNDEELQARMALKHLLIFTYSDILASQAKWRAMDWATMPKGPPPGTD